MSVTVSSYGSLARILTASQAVSARFAELSRQVTTGKKAEHFGGLGALARASIDLRAEMAHRETYVTAIKDGLVRADAMQQALARIGGIADDMAKLALQLSGTFPDQATTAAQQARAALEEVATLLNTQINGAYLFSGTDSSHPAVPDARRVLSSDFFKAIGAEVASLGSTPLATLIDRTVDIAGNSTLSIFSPFLERPVTATPPGGKGAPLRAIPAGDGLRIELDLRANENAYARPEADMPGTGSFIRDILRGLAVLGNIDEAAAGKADFAGLMSDVAHGLQSASRVLGDERAAIGQAERRLQAALNQHADIRLMLEKQLGEVEDVDWQEAVSRLQLVKTQLESSYQVIAMANEMSLAKFI